MPGLETWVRLQMILKLACEEAMLGLVEETKKETVESLNSSHWDSVDREWELDLARMLAAVTGGGACSMPGLWCRTLHSSAVANGVSSLI